MGIIQEIVNIFRYVMIIISPAKIKMQDGLSPVGHNIVVKYC